MRPIRHLMNELLEICRQANVREILYSVLSSACPRKRPPPPSAAPRGWSAWSTRTSAAEGRDCCVGDYMNLIPWRQPPLDYGPHRSARPVPEEVDFADPRDDALAALLGQRRDDLSGRRPCPSSIGRVAALRAGATATGSSQPGGSPVGGRARLRQSGLAPWCRCSPGEPLSGLHAMMFNRSRVSATIRSCCRPSGEGRANDCPGQWAEAQDEGLTEVKHRAGRD